MRVLARGLFVVAVLGASTVCGRINFDVRGGGARITFTPEQAARICVGLKSCFPLEWDNSVWGSSLASCTSSPGDIPTPGDVGAERGFSLGFEPALADFYSCVLAAGADCAAAGRCLSPASPSTACTPDSVVNNTCSGTRLEGCSADGYNLSIECADHGVTCGDYPAFFIAFNGCVFGGCPLPTRCNGPIAEVCDGGVRGHVDCAAFGLACNARAPEGVLPCKGAACDGTTHIDHCDGTTAVTCHDGTLVRLDCSRLPTQKRCISGECVATFTECDPGMTADTCQGDSIRFCQDGAATVIDCRELGFSTCQNARCVP